MLSGNNIISFYLGTMLTNAGISDPDTQLQINIYLNIWCLAMALAGTSLLDRLGRKTLAAISTAALLVLIFAFGAPRKAYGQSVNKSAIYGTVAVLFLFQGAYSFAWTPLAMLHPLEVLNYSLRLVGMGMFAFWTNRFGVMATMAFPFALEKIAWKTYMINGAWDVVQLVFIMMFWVETKGRTLEEIDELFDGIKHSDGPDIIEAVRVTSREGGMLTTTVVEMVKGDKLVNEE